MVNDSDSALFLNMIKMMISSRVWGKKRRKEKKKKRKHNLRIHVVNVSVTSKTRFRIYVFLINRGKLII